MDTAYLQSFFSWVAGILLGTSFAFIIIRSIMLLRRKSPDQQSDIDTESKPLELELALGSDIPEPPYDIPNRDYVPVITSRTTPGHALSDMDRDVKLHKTYFGGLKDPEVGIRYE